MLTRQNEQLSKYGDTKSARNIMLVELKKLIEANPLFRDKLAFPTFKASRLRTLINQRLQAIHLFLFPSTYVSVSIAKALPFFFLKLYKIFVIVTLLSFSFNFQRSVAMKLQRNFLMIPLVVVIIIEVITIKLYFL